MSARFARRVLVESPYAGDVAANMDYARMCAKDCIIRNESPFASHLFYTQFLDDAIPEERAMGIEAGLAWGAAAHATVVYTDRGISKGMRHGIKRALSMGRPVEYRTLPGYAKLVADRLG